MGYLAWRPIGAQNNAYTSNDRKRLLGSGPLRRIPALLDGSGPVVRSLQVTEEAYEISAVVIQEYNQRCGNAPYGIANLRLFTQPWTGYLPYECP